MVQEWFEEHNEVLTCPLNPIKHLWDEICGAQTSLIHGGPTSQLTGLQKSAANILVPDTTVHLQGSSGVHTLTGSKRGANTILGR